MQNNTYTFDADFLPYVEAEVEKVNKRAAKNSLAPFSLQVLGTGTRKDGDNEKDTVTVALQGQTVVVSGWSLVGVVEFGSNGNILREVPGSTIPTEYRHTCPSRCDHCRKDRPRKEGFILSNEANQTQQVGRTCLKDFFGHNPEGFLAFVSCLRKLEDMFTDVNRGESRIPRAKWAITPQRLLAWTSLVMRHEGWTSRSGAGYGETPTANTVANLLFQHNPTLKRFRETYGEAKPTEQDTERANAVITWAKGLDVTDNNYLYNLQTALERDVLFSQHIGVVASGISAMERALLKATKAAEKDSRGEVPAPEGRMVVQGVVLSRKEKESQYGWTIKLLLEVKGEGGFWKLWVTEPRSLECSVGDTVSMTVTVQPSDRDPAFAFGSRPSKAQVL